MNHLKLKIENGGLWIENRPSRFEDFITPHQHLIHAFLFIHCRESHSTKPGACEKTCMLKVKGLRFYQPENRFQVVDHSKCMKISHVYA